ncbi:energy-coupling factor ABC transporter ATP-binding protein [Corynebacterium sp. TAE3-ERU12]|uniref:energy-coupling factor ABC transporter ATP-binding protein n=1 Tax=Corynebacterium sp. TAE3-ERU12 TaxID=2849491 RepID=UPI001C484B98|nr:ABC transporter ATP-binding protein [Corynebacterium sp. TAE3-ERU12]MBV7295274.1 energy-coupling factor ABC transporter ATP-binding protein [Corynebacterium sp. TAE3-ERU12]
MPTIQFTDVTCDFFGRRAIGPVSVALSEQRIGIIGPNGGGKSTFVRLINGLDDATTGTVTVDGVNPSSDGRAVRRRVGFVFSDADSQIVMPTVAEDVGFSLRQRKVKKADRAEMVSRALADVGLADHADASPHTLSGGQKQLLALTSVLVLEPDLIIADEPTTLLDLRNRRQLHHVFAELAQQLIVVSHDLDFLEGFDRVLCFEDGLLVDDGEPERVIADYVARMGG